MDEQAFVRLLEAVLTPDSNSVREATKSLQEQYKNPQALLTLVQVVRHHQNQNVRQLAAVEARSLVPKFWGVKNNTPKIPDDVKSQIRNSLLESATDDSFPFVRHSAARAISAIAKIELPVGLWADLPNNLIQAAASPKADDREIGTYILYTLLETLEDNVASRWQEFLQLFSQTINDPESAVVRVNTLLALGKITEFLSSEEYPDAVNAFRELIPAMVAVLRQVVDAGDEEKANSAFEVFQTLLIVDPAIISSHFRDLVQFFSDLSISKNLDDDVRSKALSFLMSCLRYKKMKIQALRIGGNLTLRAMEIVTEFKELDDSDEMTPSRTALQLLDYMAASLPPSQVVVPLLNALPQYTNHTDPDYRKAGVLALGYCVEGAPDFVVTQLNSIFPVILQLLNDPETRVRKSALHAVTQLADDLHDELGKEHARLVPILIQMLDSPDGPDTWSRACNAIDAVFVGVDQADVVTYLPTLIPKLTALFQKDDFKLKAAAAGGISSTAISAKEHFMPYFQEIMQGLSPYVSLKHSEDELDLRGVVLDCMGSIAAAIGLQAFTPYVQPLMQSAEESLNLGHPRLRETAFMFFGTIAKIYGEEFKPFLEGTTQALFQSLNQEETELDFKHDDIASKVVSIGLGDNKVNISGEIVHMDGSDDEEEEDDAFFEELSPVNAVALEKEVAAETLGEILSNCQNAFIPYLERTVKILREKASHPYEGVRKAAIGTLWRAYATLWQVCEKNGMQKWQKGLPLKVRPTTELQQLASLVADTTIDNLKEEIDKTTITVIFQNLAETVKLCGPAIFADADGTTILEFTTQVFLVLSKQHPAQTEDEDEEETPELQESSEFDWVLIDSAMDVLLAMAVSLGPQYSDVWKVVSQHLIKYASSSEPTERSTSVGVIAESIKHMEAAVTPYTEKLLTLLLHRVSDEDPDTKANAVYAIGLLCYFSQDKEIVLSQYNNILQNLERFLIRSPEDSPRLLDNAAGCLARMISANPDNVSLDQVLPVLAAVLPLKEDFEENEPIYKVLVKLYQSSNQVVFGMTQQFVPVFAQVLGPPEEQLGAGTRTEMIELIKFLASKEPGLIQSFPNLVQLAQ